MKRLGFIVLIVCMLSACSSRLVYNNLDWLVLWYADDFVSLNAKQASQLETALQQVLSWHRKQALLKYRRQLINIRSDLQTNTLDAHKWLGHLVLFRKHWHEVRFQSMEKALPLLTQLKPTQSQELFENLNEKNLNDKEDYDALTVEERQQNKYKKIEDAIEDLTGDILPIQQDLLKQLLQQQVDTRLRYLDYSLSVQQSAHAALEAYQGEPTPETKQQLLILLTEPQLQRPADLQQDLDVNRKHLADFLAELTLTLTAHQREYFMAETKRWLDLIEDLQAEE